MRKLTLVISAILVCATAASGAASKKGGGKKDGAYGIGDTPKVADKAKAGKADKNARPEGGGEWKNKDAKGAKSAK